MSTAAAVRVQGDYLSFCREANKRVASKVRVATGVNPRTKVAGYSDFFRVDISTGSIYVATVGEDVVEGYLAHENGHRSVFPASSAGWMAFLAAVREKAPAGAVDGEVRDVANVVADAFSDYLLHWSGLGRILSKRVQDFVSRSGSHDAPSLFKVLVYRSIEVSSKKGKRQVDEDNIDEAYSQVVQELEVDQGLADEVVKIAKWFASRSNLLLSFYSPKDIAEFLLNPFNKNLSPDLSFLPEIARLLMELNRRMQHQQSSGGAQQHQPGKGGQGQHQQPSGGEHQCGCARSGGGSGAQAGGAAGAEGADIVVTSPSHDDVHKAIEIASRSFNVSSRSVSMHIDSLFSEELRDTVRRLLERVRVMFAQHSTKTKPAGFVKETAELWLNPWGDVDEDSMLVERHKILWTVEVKRPIKRGRLDAAKASPPDKVVVVIDESGSTSHRFGSTSVLSVEALVAILCLGGLKYVGGAKEVTVVKFSDTATAVYRGKDVVEASTKILVPHEDAGGGTNIRRAVRVGLGEVGRNSALIVLTDLEISEGEAEAVAKEIGDAVRDGRVGFVVFLVINQSVDKGVLDVLRSHVSGAKAVVEVVSSAEDLAIVGNNIVSKVLSYTHT